MLRKIRAMAVVGSLWATAWAVVGMAVNAWRFLMWPGLEHSFWNWYPWMRIGFIAGTTCGFVAGATFGMMLAILPPLTGSRISARWSLVYGIASGLAASVYVLPVGYGPTKLPLFAAVFSVTGAVTALAIAALTNRDPIPQPSEELVR